MGRVTGKVAVISGAARGQGRSHARMLAAEGEMCIRDSIVAISVPAPTERFLEKEQQIIAALRTAAESSAWTR